MSTPPYLRATLLSLFISASACADPLLYSINFLPSGFASSAMNNTGQIVGTYGGAAAIYADGSIMSLAGIAPNSYGQAINDRGDIAGSHNSPFSGRAFAVIGGSLVPVSASVPADFPYSNATGINNAGTVVGLAAPFIGESVRGYVYSEGSVRIIPTLGGDMSTADAVNSSGAVVGTAAVPLTESWLNPDRHAYIDRGGVMQDLGTLGGLRSEAYDINDAGLVAGWSEDATGQVRPFLYRDGAMVDLGSLGGYYGYARALNNAGIVVGESDLITDVGWGARAFLYRDGAMADLNALVAGAAGWEIVDATDINDAGQILGRACRLGSCTDVRLDLVPAVPEPGAWLLLLAGLALLGWRCRRRRPPSRAPSLLALTLPLACAAPAALAEPLYNVTFLPQNLQNAVAVDNGGRVVGTGINPDGYLRAYVWEDGNVSYLPTLGGRYASAAAIESGIVAGTSLSGDFNRGFLYRDGNIERIGTLYGGESFGYGVNAAGQVVGDSIDAAGNSRAFLYSGGSLTDIGTLGGQFAQARDINNAGAVVGSAQLGPDAGGYARAFVYRDGVMTDLGSLDGTSSAANAINDAGQVAGYSAGDAFGSRPFLYSGGTMIDIGSFGGGWGNAYGINNAGMVVGASSLPGFGFSHGFLYDDGTLHDLNELTGGLGSFVVTEALGINDFGQITGRACSDFGGCAAVLLTPVPEPAAAFLLLAGVPLVLRRCRRG